MIFEGYLLVRIIIMASVLSGTMLNSPTKEPKEQCPNIKTSLASVRKRRHLAFPEGSAVSVTTSVVKAFMTHAPSGWFTVVEAELVYTLPNAEVISASKRRKLHHRQKRELWEVLQNAFDQRNLNGHSCVIRTVCEAEKDLAPPGRSLVHDILRAMFTAPVHEADFTQEIDSTYNEMSDPNYCDKPNDCPFSSLTFILDLNKQK